MNTLQAGPVTAEYEYGFLRRLSYAGHEVVRMIYFALRDHNWNTLNHRIENENSVIRDDSFAISYECFHMDGGIDVMQWSGKIAGGPDGSITFEINGTTLQNFRKNRAGFCVLHPLSACGHKCEIRHPDGSKTVINFPERIAADNPFKYIQSMNWEVDGTPFSLTFEGDVFETEDQRNWGDASFKTFCTPLDIPFPVELKKGQQVFQRITFKPLVRLSRAHKGSASIELKDIGVTGVLPLLGIGASSEIDKLPENAVSSLRSLRLSHYRADFYPAADDFAVQYSNAYENAFSAGIPLEVVLHLTDNFAEEMEAFSILSLQNKVRLKKLLLLSTNAVVTRSSVIENITSLKKALPKVLIGAGTNYNFNELNKNQIDATNLDFVSFAMDPQEHATDDLTILENSATLEHLANSTRVLFGDKLAIHVSPVTLRKRFNPYATNPADLFIPEEKKADPRQKDQLTALWTFGCLCSLVKGKAAAVTLYQTIGAQGVMSLEGKPYPVFDVIKRFAPYQGKRLNILGSSDPLSISGAVLDGKMLAVANVTNQEKSVQWNGSTVMLRPGEIRYEAV